MSIPNRLVWDSLDSRFYEHGVDHGVVYPSIGEVGVPWNGLINVTETYSDADSTPQYIDGVKVLEWFDHRDFEATIEAYTYPDEIEEYEGIHYEGGLGYDQQEPKPFNFAYRTLVGGYDNPEQGYKIHIVYNAYVTPSDRSRQTISADPEAITFSWDVTTTASFVTGKMPLSHFIVDSRKVYPEALENFENLMFGGPGRLPRLVSPEELVYIFETHSEVEIVPYPTTGLNALKKSDLYEDLEGNRYEGLYSLGDTTRLTDPSNTGFYGLV